MEYYSVIKKSEMRFTGKWLELQILMLSKISQAQKDEHHDSAHLQNLSIEN
jgi:hypothetical protein